MSRIGRMPIALPKGVDVKIAGKHVAVKGPKGLLERDIHPDISVNLEDGHMLVTRPSDERQHRALHGLTRALLNNMVQGVTQGFKRDLEIEGVGYRGELQGKNLVLSLGFSHPVIVEPPTGISFVVDRGQRLVTVEGIDKELVGQIAANIRKLRPPEPYKGKGIHYVGERIIRKAGKAGKAK
ncbi:MAG: 50S ribosomal protein L6 [Chloroflexi bacterium]|nr:50S ribosomal protein L6 [Chloroflexota bacterium]